VILLVGVLEDAESTSQFYARDYVSDRQLVA
jgi:hypothetical protein